MTVKLLADVNTVGLKGDLVSLTAERARRLVDSGKAVLDPPDQEWPP